MGLPNIAFFLWQSISLSSFFYYKRELEGLLEH
jgi:hypothetical protein